MENENLEVVYGSIYADEFADYEKVIEEQFKSFAERLNNGSKISAWAFDVGVRESEQSELFPPTFQQQKKIEAFTRYCSVKYLPGVQCVSDLLELDKKE